MTYEKKMKKLELFGQKTEVDGDRLEKHKRLLLERKEYSIFDHRS